MNSSKAPGFGSDSAPSVARKATFAGSSGRALGSTPDDESRPAASGMPRTTGSAAKMGRLRQASSKGVSLLRRSM